MRKINAEMSWQSTRQSLVSSQLQEATLTTTNTNTNMKITANTETGETIRLSLPAATWEGADKYGTGVTLEAIYVSPRARRCVIQTYSIWENGQGACTGTLFSLVEDEDQLNRFAAEYPEVGEAFEKAGIVTAEEL